MEVKLAFRVYFIEIVTTESFRKKLAPAKLKVRTFIEQVIKVDVLVAKNITRS